MAGVLLGGCGPSGPPTSDGGAPSSDSGAPSADGGRPIEDLDRDGVEDARDNCPEAPNPLQQDTDEDGVGDACATGPCSGFGGDRDRDDVCQSRDNCPDVPNSSQQDADDDGIGDACDATPNPCDDRGGDADGDGLCSDVDNCPEHTNAHQLDQDGDGRGDVCDSTPVVLPAPPCAGRGGDADADDVCQAGDNCPESPNPDQRDSDVDGVGDACDATPQPCDDHGGDTDRDTICNDFDNCPAASNRNQSDADLDGIGDVCDTTPPPDPSSPCGGRGGDIDRDEWCGLDDNCPNVANPRQDDTDGDGLGDACDVEVCDGGDDDGDGSTDEGFADEDADGVADCVDPCPGGPNVDGDGDTLFDCADACPLDPLNDRDGDRVCGDRDNCPTRSNYTQADGDADGVGDACDVEECDGVDNDGDGSIDESLPDADADGVCDAVDTCPDDTVNDPDADGRCALVDNCPLVANAGQEDADADGSGDGCDLDFVCDPAAPLAGAGEVALPATLGISDLVGDPVRPVVYAALRSTSSSYPNSVIAIDPPTRSVLWSVLVGSDPWGMAISDDGSRLYVGFNGSSTVRLVALGTRRACRSFPLGSATYGGPRYAGDMGVLPGQPETLLVAARLRGTSPSFDGVFVFDDGQRRPVGTARHTGASRIEVASRTTAYGFNDTSTEFGFRRLLIDATGVREDWVERTFFSGFSNDIHYAGGRVFGKFGEVADPTVPMIVGTLPHSGPIVAAPEIERSFTATTTGVGVGNLTSFVSARTIPYPTGFSGPTRIVRWGARGLALASTDRIAFLADAVVP